MEQFEQDGHQKKGTNGLIVNERIEFDTIEVLVNKMTVKDNCVREPDEICLAVNVTYRNTDRERKRIDLGALFIMYNQKEYVFTRSLADWHDDWEIILDHQESKTTDLIYRIPYEIQGQVYYEPEYNFDGSKIYLGTYEMGKLIG